MVDVNAMDLLRYGRRNDQRFRMDINTITLRSLTTHLYLSQSQRSKCRDRSLDLSVIYII